MNIIRLFSLPIIFHTVIQNVAGKSVQVRVKQGWLEGEVLDLLTRDGRYYSFKGIPYAQPPIGTLRFKAPRGPPPWTGVRKAKHHGSVCPQRNVLTNKFIPGNEDCLFLNVYSPNLKPKRLLSVIVFVHTEAYKSGSGNVDFFGPDFLIKKNMVIVTFNYRLDALGFLSLGTKDVPGNAGLKDQVAALKWVQKNIEYFGGDPNRVTLIGANGAGGACVSLHVISPMSKGLFQRALVMSGSSYCDWAFSFQPERRAFVLGKQLGFKTEDPYELLKFLQSVPSEKLVDTSPNILSFEEYTYNIIKMYQFVPVVEKYCGKDNFLSYNILDGFKHVNKVDVMFGHTNQELTAFIQPITSTLIPQYDKYPELFVPRKLLNHYGPNTILKLSDINFRRYYFGTKSVDINSTKEFVRYANDATFIYDIFKFFSSLPDIENTVRYSYRFSMTSRRNVYGPQGEKYGIFGAGHLDDLLYMNEPYSMNLVSDKGSVESELIDKYTTLITDFAKHGNPFYSSANGTTWPMFNTWTKQYVDLSNKGSQVIATVLSMNNNDSFNFWEHLYSSIGRLISKY